VDPAPEPLRPRGEWAEVRSPTTVLPRRPHGVVPHADFRAALGTSWSAPPALQPLGHHLTLDAPAGLLAAAAVPVEAYAGADLRFTPVAAEQADLPTEPAAPRPRLLDRVLRRPAAVPSSPTQPPAAPQAAPIVSPHPEPPVLHELHQPEPWPTLTPGAQPQSEPLLAAAAPAARLELPEPSAPAPVEAPPPATYLPAAGPAPVVPAAEVVLEQTHRPVPARSDVAQPSAGRGGAEQPVVTVPQRRLLGHRALGADLVAAAADVVLPRPVAALAPVALPAPVAGRVTAATPSDPADLAAPRPERAWARPAAGYAPSTTPVAEHPPYARASVGLAADEVPAPVEREPEVPAPPADPVEPVPGLPDWWPAESATWTVGDTEPDSVPDPAVRRPEPSAGRPDTVPNVSPDAALPHLALPEVAVARSVTHAEPVLQRRVRQTRDPATGTPVTRRVAWPLDVPVAAGSPDRQDRALDAADPDAPATEAPDVDDPAHDEPGPDGAVEPAPPETAAPSALLPGAVGPGLRRVVRAPSSPPPPTTGHQTTQAFPLIGPGDLPDLRHRIEQTEPPELPEPAPRAAPGEAAGDQPAASRATAGGAAGAGTQPTRAPAAPTADEVAGQLRHTLLVERERFGVLADLW
jgi:hypothetical protein